ncbi:hypothetical protein ACUXAV_002561 [Cupriavidus metallidurans]|jgi:hypothetical protein|nr:MULTISPECIES: hypothetical protein [Cupriavidus]KWW39572.1 hypothetical protein AU374_00638 [Cupriavidus metallidurans]MDE4920790.1 hypothetical protein [Cupriavidus metallidurans]QGS32914.1 hypothetical protein FOB83_29425 [Cupriavidus metallidurans]
MNNWLKERFSDPNRAMDTLCTVAFSLCGLLFVYFMVLVVVAQIMFRS